MDALTGRTPRAHHLRSPAGTHTDEAARVDADELVIEMDRGEFPQRVTVHDPSEVRGALRPGRVVTLAGWLRVEEDGTYAVEFIPDRGSDREWWRNLRENIDALF